MANSNLSASADFFKQLSLEYHQLEIAAQLLGTYATRALGRGYEVGDKPLMILLEQFEALVALLKRLLDHLEGLLEQVVITA